MVHLEGASHWDGGEAEGRRVEVGLPDGITEVTLTVTDDDGVSSTDSIGVTVRRQSRIIAAFCGRDHTLMLKRDGTLWGAGDNFYGALGLGEQREARSFTLIVNGGVVGVSASPSHSLFWKDDGSLWGMGYNDAGALGDSVEGLVNVPTMIVEKGVVSAVAGDRNTFYILDDGSLWAMGLNEYGQLGDGTNLSRQSPVKIVESSVRSVSVATRYALLVKNDGSLWATGAQFLKKAPEGITIPFEIISEGVAETASYDNYSIIVKEDRSLLWHGSLPVQSPLTNVSSGGIAELPIADVEWACAGRYVMYVKTYDGILHEVTGRLSNRIRVADSQIAGVDSVASGVDHTMFVKADGSLWGVGENRHGKLGLDGGSLYPEPTVVIGATGMYGFSTWLSSFFSEEEIAAMGAGIALADPDEDGISNISEKLFGLSPIAPFNPFHESNARAQLLIDGMRLQVGPYASGLRYTLFNSTNLVDWRKLSVIPSRENGMLYFDIPVGYQSFYKVEIAE